MREQSEAAPRFDPQARVFSMGAYVARHLPAIDRDQQSDKARRLDDDRLVRINNRYAELGLALTMDSQPQTQPTIIPNLELESLHANNNDLGNPRGQFYDEEF